MQINSELSIKHKTANATRKDSTVTFLYTATPAEIKAKVSEKLDGATAIILRTQMRVLFTTVFIALAHLLKKKEN